MSKTDIMPPEIQAVFATYPQAVSRRLLSVRDLIFSIIQSDNIDFIEETLKWGQPSYFAKKGTAVRLGWDKKAPQQYGIYFHCQTTLIATFRSVYGDTFQYSANRAIIFTLEESIASSPLKQCLSAALRYHTIKHLPSLGLS